MLLIQSDEELESKDDEENGDKNEDNNPRDEKSLDINNNEIGENRQGK